MGLIKRLATRARQGTARPLAALAFVLLCAQANAIPFLLDWDTLTWLPPGNTNLTQTYNIDGTDVVVTFGGNTAGLDQEQPIVSPSLNIDNTGGLIPGELALDVATDYLDQTNPQITVTIDFSAFPGGVENVSFSIFDVDNFGAFIDQVTVTAIANGVAIDPTSLVTSAANQIDAGSTNTVTGTANAGPTSADANLDITFAQSNITQILLVYRNVTTLANPGFQLIHVHDISYNFVTADVSVTKTVDNDVPPVGTNVVYTLTTTNDGPDTATGLVVTDQLPAGLTYVSDTSGGAYDPVTGLWTVGTLAPAASATIDITALVNPTGPYDNSAELTAANELDPDSTPNNNDPTEDDQDNAPITPTAFADLSLTKTVDQTEPVAGSNVDFTVTITNDGPVDGTGITVADALPSGYLYVADGSTQGPYDPVTGIWTVGALAAGNSATLTITAQVLFSGNYLNIAEVATADQPDADSTPGNGDPTEDDQAEALTTPVAIGVAKSVSFGPVNNGNGTFSFIYTIDVQNFGGTDLQNLQVVDDLATTFAAATGFVVDSVASNDFTVNPAYNGATDTNLLAGTDTLATGQNGMIALAVTLTPGPFTGPYLNTATGSGVSPGGTPVTDDSQLGVDPDPDSDGDPTNNNVPTPVNVIESPQIGLAKRVSAAPVNNMNGSFTLAYEFLIQNFGDVTLGGLQLVDDLSVTYNGAQSFTVDAIASADFAVNTNYDGVTDTDLLAGTDTLALGGTGTVQVTLTVVPGGNLGPYNNTSVVNGTSPAGTPISDVSTDGVSTDPDGDNDPSNNSVPTPVAFMEAPLIGVAKRVSAGPVNNGDGTFNASYTILIENAGDVLLSDVQITDNLGATFANAVSYTVDAITSPDLAFNPNFDGANDINLLLGTDTLAVGATGSVSVDLTIVPGANPGPYNNTAVGMGISPANTPVQDNSQDGVDPDPDMDNNPTNNNVPTPLTLLDNPALGVAKVVPSEAMDNNNGTFTFRYNILVENVGDVILSELQVTDDIATAFAASDGFIVNAVQSSDFIVNPGFNGASDQNLLQGTDTLAIGAQGRLTVILTVTPGGFSGPYLNTAVGTANSPGGQPVQDESTDGVDPDPDMDGDPGNNTDPTPITFATPVLVLTKTAQPREVSTGDLVRYAITVENQGGGGLTNLTLSDQIPAGFTYVDGSARRADGGPLIVSGERPLMFDGIDIAAGQTIIVNYMLRVGAGVTRGRYPNVVTPLRNGTPVGDPATAVVEVVADPDLEQTTVTGMVFGDPNANGLQDEGEVGIPGVRLATVEGLLIETDAYGRYHLAGLDGGFLERGRNFIIKVDPATLPDGAQFTTENPRVKRITQGLMNRFDFGVRLPDDEREVLLPINVKIAEVFFETNSAEIHPKFDDAFAELAERLRDHCGGTLFIEGNDPPNCMDIEGDRLSTKVETESFVLIPHFGIREDTLRPEDKKALAGLVDRWRGAQDATLTSTGHTSSVRIAPEHRDEFADNCVLGKARAETVANYLLSALALDASQSTTVEKCVHEPGPVDVKLTFGSANDRHAARALESCRPVQPVGDSANDRRPVLTLKSCGPFQPVGDNTTVEGRAKNRRVVLTLTGRRVLRSTIAGESRACDPDLAERRARLVSEKLESYLGEMVCGDVKVIVGDPP